MKVIKIIGILILVVVGVGLITSAILPKEMNVDVEQTITAPIDVVWDNISTFEKSDKWSPWYDEDPDMKVEFIGESGTVGSSFTWSGNEKVQTGEQTMTTVDAENHVLETHVKHNWGEGNGKMTVEDLGDGTVKVTRNYIEKTGIPGNVFSTLMGAEDMMTKSFAKGLDNLKVIAEEEAQNIPEPVTYEVKTVDREAQKYLGHKEVVKMENMKDYFETNMPKIGSMMADATGPPSALYFSWNTTNQESEMTVAMPTSLETAPEGYEFYDQPAGQYLLVEYKGDYSEMGDAHGTINAYMAENNLTMTGAVLEEYITDPTTVDDPSEILTNILYPVAAQEGEE